MVRKRWDRVRTQALSALLVVVVPYGAIIGWLKANESDLVFRASMSRAADDPRGARPDYLREVRIPFSPVSVSALEGLVLEAATERARGTWILHLHGNADSAFSAGQIRHAIALRDQGFNVLAVDYRGFGRSAGTPSEANILEDAETAFRWLTDQGVVPRKIIVWGHSLGSAPAVALAAQHPVAGLVTFGAFTSVPDRGAELYPWLPVRWIASIQFDNRRRLAEVGVPVVIVHAKTDRTIPVTHAQALFGAAKEPKRLLRLDARSEDGFGGHYEAAYEQVELVVATMTEVMPLGDPGDPAGLGEGDAPEGATADGGIRYLAERWSE